MPLDELQDSLVRGLQKNAEPDQPEEEGDEFLAAEEALSDFAAMGFGAPPPATAAPARSDDGDGKPEMVGIEDIGGAEAAAEKDGEPQDG